MALLLALLAAGAYGVSDFLAGVVSRRVSPWSVAVVGQAVGAVGLLVLAVLAGDPAGWPGAGTAGWVLLAGVGNGAGTAFLYRGLAAGRMGVVGPVSAVGAALVPAAAGLALGERPGLLVALGLVAAAPGIWLVAAEPTAPGTAQRRRAAGLLDGVAAGLGFGVLFAALAQVPEDAGLVPVAAQLAVGAVATAALAVVLAAPWWPREAGAWWGAVCGSLGAAAAVAFLLASRSGLTVSAVVVSLYPAVTVLLAAAVLRERVHRAQGVGLVLCGVCVALVAAG